MLCFVSIDKHDVQGVIHAGFMYHSCVTLVSIETENRYCSESSGKRIYMYLWASYFVDIRSFFAENKEEKSGKQAEMFRNTPIFRLSTPGCCHSLHPDVRDGYTRMHRVFSYWLIVIKILIRQEKTICIIQTWIELFRPADRQYLGKRYRPFDCIHQCFECNP